MPTVLSTFGGNPALQPQRSNQVSAGLVFDRAKEWYASVDVWAVRVKDTIGSLEFQQVVNDIAAFEGKNVIRGPVDPAFPDLPGPIVRILTINENLGDQRVSGADVALHARPRETPLGRFSASLDGTYVFQARQELVVGQPVELMGRVVPRWNHLLTLNLDRGAWTTTLSQRYRRGYTDQNPLPDGTTRRVASYIVWDGQVAVDVARTAKLWLGVRNLLDTPPPFTNSTFNFQTGYDPGYADPQGRTWTLGVRVAWR
jgi:iron complex outermembrane receptor protein